MIVIHHNKDMDGYASGAICKFRYPDARLIGWDYKDPIPDFEQFTGEDVIMIDITFPIDKIKELGNTCNQLTVIDHHISFKKEYDLRLDVWDSFLYIYKDRQAACEVGWKYLFPDKGMPFGIKLIGRYDTWRKEEGDWEKETLPFKYYMYGNCNSAENFPVWILDSDMKMYVDEVISSGVDIMNYQKTMDEASCRNSFERDAYGYKALCINYYPFSSDTLESVYNLSNHDIMVGFAYTGSKWSISLRSTNDIDVSVIAKSRGGGGHKQAAGFEVERFEDIFK